MSVVHRLTPVVRDLGRAQEHWHASRVAVSRLEEFLATPTGLREPAGAADLRPGPGRLELVDVHYGDVLSGVTATAEAGSVVALVGPNGAGKSTLLALVARLADPDGGAILLDGQDLGAHRLDSVRRAVALAGPDVPLLRGTVGRNLRYRHPNVDAGEERRIRALCRLDRWVASLPDGDATRLTEGGRSLSGGQRQQLVLARAVLGGPSVLLLDEADSAMDGTASAAVDAVLAAHRGTVLLVTHRRERVAAADAVWHLDAGRILEAGLPADLLAGDGPTARLFRPASVAGPPGFGVVGEVLRPCV